jgi:cholesterol oxidase
LPGSLPQIHSCLDVDFLSIFSKVYDFIVIGSGFGGSVAALRLAEKGYSVLVIEKGKRYSHQDFPKTNWNLRKYLWLPALRMFGIQKLTLNRHASILSGVGVGGGSLVYANTLFHPPDEFFRHPSWRDFGDWKVILDPFYSKAAFMMGRTRYRRRNPEDDLLLQVAGEMGRAETFDNVFVGVYLDGGKEEKTEKDPYFGGLGPKRKPCTECAGCMVGCLENAKNSLDKNYLFFAEKMGTRILAETRALRIDYRNGRYLVGTRSTTSLFGAKKQVYEAGGLILAGGTLGTMELLLKQKYLYRSLPGLSDRLGEGVLTNSESLCAISGIPDKMNNGLAITSVFNPDENTHVEVVKYPKGSNALRVFFTLTAGGARNNLLRSLGLARNILARPGRFLKVLFRPGWSDGLVILLVMQHIENAMALRWRKSFSGGRMVFDNTGKKKVPAYIEIGQDVMKRYAEKSCGIAQNVILEVLFNRPTTAHILGGCPMSHSIESGVIDPRFRVHGYPGMYIVDGSAIQGNIGVNPSFTILAAAEYAMANIPDKANNTRVSLEKQLEKIL